MSMDAGEALYLTVLYLLVPAATQGRHPGFSPQILFIADASPP